MTDVGLRDIVAAVQSNLELMIDDAGGKVMFEGAAVVRFNETRLLQVMQNLIGNAIKYRGSEAPVVAVSAEREQAGWIICVRDNGAGFEMKYAEQIFEPFRRLRRDEDRGAGIGLAICRKIVESRGGRIWAESAPGTGSAFFFTVPDALPSGE